MQDDNLTANDFDKGDIITFNFHETGEEIKGIIYEIDDHDGILRVWTHEGRIGEKKWACEFGEVNDTIGHYDEADHYSMIGRNNAKMAIEAAENGN